MEILSIYTVEAYSITCLVKLGSIYYFEYVLEMFYSFCRRCTSIKLSLKKFIYMILFSNNEFLETGIFKVVYHRYIIYREYIYIDSFV